MVVPFSMEREHFHNFVVKCGPYMKEQLQKEVPDYLLDHRVITKAEYDEITSSVRVASVHRFLNVRKVNPTIHFLRIFCL